MADASATQALSVATPAPAANKNPISRFFARGNVDAARRVANAMASALILGLIAVAIGASSRWVAALLWAGASSAVGWVIGFLFGIPRTLASDSATPPAGGSGQPHAGTNTNLEQISDWLTKIIVGVTLVQAGPVLAHLDQAAQLIAESLGGANQKSFAYALMLYFAITGFLGSYLLTRLFLQPAFDKEP